MKLTYFLSQQLLSLDKVSPLVNTSSLYGSYQVPKQKQIITGHAGPGTATFADFLHVHHARLLMTLILLFISCLCLQADSAFIFRLLFSVPVNPHSYLLKIRVAFFVHSHKIVGQPCKREVKMSNNHTVAENKTGGECK